MKTKKQKIKAPGQMPGQVADVMKLMNANAAELAAYNNAEVQRKHEAEVAMRMLKPNNPFTVLVRSYPGAAAQTDGAFVSVIGDLAEGRAVSRTGWLGYWVWNPKTRAIDMHCMNGKICHGDKNVALTISNVVSLGWYVLTGDQRALLDRIHEAVRNHKLSLVPGLGLAAEKGRK